MFIGHFAVAFAVKPLAPRTSLGTLFISAQFLDLLWPILLLLGLERVKVEPGITVVTPFDFEHYPISHSLLTTIIWAGLFGAGYYLVVRYDKGAMCVGLGVASHWVLDLVTHRPDLPIYPGGEQLVGLGLWNSLPGTLIVESALFAGAVLLYVRRSRPNDKAGQYALWSLVGFLILIYMGNMFGPTPPDNPRLIAISGVAMWLFVAWAFWVDRHRKTLAFRP